MFELPRDPRAPAPTARFKKEFEEKYLDSDPPIVITPVSLNLIQFQDREAKLKRRKKLPGAPKEPFVSLSDRARIGELMSSFLFYVTLFSR